MAVSVSSFKALFSPVLSVLSVVSGVVFSFLRFLFPSFVSMGGGGPSGSTLAKFDLLRLNVVFAALLAGFRGDPIEEEEDRDGRRLLFALLPGTGGVSTEFTACGGEFTVGEFSLFNCGCRTVSGDEEGDEMAVTDDGEHNEADSIDLLAKAGLIATSFSANDWLATPVVLF